MRKVLALGLVAAVTAGGTLAACNTASENPDDGSVPTGVTFHKDVEPLLHKHCLTCHSEGQIGGFSLAQYADAKKLANLMVQKTERGEMPPFSAQNTDQCQPRFGWRDDPRLTADELATLKSWADNGTPEGDPKDAPPPFELKAPGLPGTELEITAPEATTVDGVKDQFICVVYDPKLTETKYLDGLHFVAGNTNVAHHALLFQVKKADIAPENAGASQFPCFGTPSDNPTLLNAWAPGSVPLELPADVGMEIGADDLIVIQMHYHPRDKSESDQSKIQLRFADAKPKWSYVTALIGNAGNADDGLLPGPNDTAGPEFRIPANVKGHTEDMEFTLGVDTPGPYPVLAVGTHMHYVGVDMRFSVERFKGTAEQPKDECLIETPHWDFNWQRWYQYDTDISTLPTLGLGDKLKLHCEYDNTLENPFVYTALQQQGMSQPTEVRLGEMTLDEMCLGVVGVLVPN